MKPFNNLSAHIKFQQNGNERNFPLTFYICKTICTASIMILHSEFPRNAFHWELNEKERKKQAEDKFIVQIVPGRSLTVEKKKVNKLTK